MTGDQAHALEFQLSRREADALQSLLENRIEDQTKPGLANAYEQLTDACWLAQWLGEDPRPTWSAAEASCLLDLFHQLGQPRAWQAIGEQLETALGVPSSLRELVAV